MAVHESPHRLDHRRIAGADRARVRRFVEAILDAVLVVDRDGRTVIRNRAFKRLLEMARPAVKGDPAAGFDVERLRARAARGEEFVATFSVADAEGRRRWFEAHGRPVPIEMGLGEGGMLVVRDTTDVTVRRLQQQFVGIVAHELRTPLAALRGCLQLLERDRDDGVRRRALPLAIEQADRLQRLIDELFDITQVERGELTVHPEPLPLGQLIEETVAIARVIGDSHHFLVERPEADVVARVDAKRMQQVLLNLLMNAIVHAPDSPEIRVRLRTGGGRVEIAVHDEGPGIPDDLRASLFSRFEHGASGGRSGLGLGLFLSREIITAHGGTIDCDSEFGRGTTFTIRLPLQPPAPL